MRMKSNGGEDCVMKIWGAGKGFIGFTNLMTRHIIRAAD